MFFFLSDKEISESRPNDVILMLLTFTVLPTPGLPIDGAVPKPQYHLKAE